MKPWRVLKPSEGKEIPFVVMVAFLATFVISRAVVFFLPEMFLTIRSTHIHHFAYGIILLAVTNFILLIFQLDFRQKLRFAVLYGVALGLAFDEFGMWLQLEENGYWTRQNYDAIMVVALVFMNIVYFEGFWRRWRKRVGMFVKMIFS